MAESTQKVSIVTPEREVYSDEIRFVHARGTDGDLGILPRHAPLISSLQPGVLRIQKDNNWILFAVAGGFMEVSDNQVVILADAAERPEEIDVERCQKAKERAENRLSSKDQDIDTARAQVALQRALTRMEVAQKKN